MKFYEVMIASYFLSDQIKISLLASLALPVYLFDIFLTLTRSCLHGTAVMWLQMTLCSKKASYKIEKHS